MADDKDGRDKQARDADDRQRQRDVAAELERGDEPEPEIDPADLGEVEAELESLEFPATGTEIIAAIGEHDIGPSDERYTVEQLVPETDDVVFESLDRVRVRIQRPTVAAAMKRIVELSETLPDEDFGGSQHDAYEKTFLELQRLSPNDEDEEIGIIRDWAVERIREKEKLPTSRQLRRQAAKVCRENGYQIRKDDWLGI